MPTWTTNVTACPPTGSTVACEMGGTCAPDPGQGTAFNLCIFQHGDVACPTTGPYTVKSSIDTGFGNDTRSCTDCMCAPPTAKCSYGLVTLSSHSDCSSPVTTNLAGCINAGITATTAYYAELTTMATADAASCAVVPGGGMATGSVTATGPTTICCM